ncbi:MAG: hypothetical protein K2X98_00990 [Alphaproteobacteria bacterium]|nr:hypothetical protein [Alphaproteobacteria bacterium]
MQLCSVFLSMITLYISLGTSLDAMDHDDLDSTKNSSGTNERSLLVAHHHDSPAIARSNSHFLRLEKSLIDDVDDLQFWGIGLFKSHDIFGNGICRLTASKWSHIGVILKSKAHQTKYIFESTGNPSDILKGIKPQVQIHPWDEQVSAYNGNVATRKFRFQQNKPDSTNVKDYVLKNLGKPYEKDIWRLLKSLQEDNLVEDNTSMFCSELVGEMTLALKMRSDANVSENFVPRHFGDPISQPHFAGLYGGMFDPIKVVKLTEEHLYDNCCVLF